MRVIHKMGALVHIPQAVKLYQFDEEDPVALGDGCRATQLSIARYQETKKPEIGVVMDISPAGCDGYLRVYCEGEHWSVKGNNIYSLSKSG